MSPLERYFAPFRNQTIGIETHYETPYGKQPLIYADWIASGRLYAPIEKQIAETIGPFVANTHTESSETGERMTRCYHLAQQIIKRHVNAGPNDVLIATGSGMTTVINKLQRLLSLRVNRRHFNKTLLPEAERPVVFLTHMEHHSNQTSWYETLADVVVLEPQNGMDVAPEELERQLRHYAGRRYKIGSFTACSNVTGIRTPISQLARLMHQHGGLCFVDYAASAPYDDIDMHPADPLAKLDAVFFSPHKFLGGPGAPGVLVFDAALYDQEVPDCPGGGTVDWTNPWGQYKYVDNIETREDGGTPGFLQTIRAALAIRLKDAMGVANIHAREQELLQQAFAGLDAIPGIAILAGRHRDRLGILSFYHPDIHFNLMVKLLSDRYGIQMRGGCACAGTYGHYLLNVGYERSHAITDKISCGDLSEKPGWIRWSLHPTTSNAEVASILNAIGEIVSHSREWATDYRYDAKRNEFVHHDATQFPVEQWFDLASGHFETTPV